MTDKDPIISRPQKPLSFTNKKYPPKKVFTEKRNNSNNKVLNDCIHKNSLVKIHINNLLCSDKELNPTYQGNVVSFDDFTVLLKEDNRSYLINKSAIAVIEMIL